MIPQAFGPPAKRLQPPSTCDRFNSNSKREEHMYIGLGGILLLILILWLLGVI